MDKIQPKASQLWVVFGFAILIPAHLFILHSPKWVFFPNDLTCDLGISLELSPHNQMKGIVDSETLFTGVVTKIYHWRGFLYLQSSAHYFSL